ncbi:MAG: hypothetical protein WDO15_06740 [Bacteroidota bacterium]
MTFPATAGIRKISSVFNRLSFEGRASGVPFLGMVCKMKFTGKSAADSGTSFFIGE